MKFRIALLFGSVWALAAFPVWADMIEIKGKGVMNGKIISQDDSEVRFEDTTKNLFVVPKSDVLFLEAQKDAPVVAQKKGLMSGPAGGWKPNFADWRKKAGHYFDTAKRFVIEKTKGISDFITAPLDRSAANSRSGALANSMGDLSKNLKSLNKQDRKRAVQLRGIQDDHHATSKSKSKHKGTGAFASLD